ncbi:Acetylcholinesterase [Oryzias melastigma]|uniref:Carboxylic ester hydrolase n=1 Tax=Oryzias melastigma TaxID=30732 RepID=A0A834F7C2_ORYME|nr:Acetylcholinesterase [Oryzias melastigma]
MASVIWCTRFAVLPLLLHILTVSFATRDDLVINTTHGKVQGKLISVLGGEVRAFLGIPYGKPPIGKLRFRAPEPAEKWVTVKDATKFPNSCHQIPDETFPGFQGAEMWNPNTPLSEDCLYLNVWTPVVNKTQPLALAPVLVWIHGGGFVTGTSTIDVYHGHILSKSEGVVIVSMNYRLGVFGFLSLPDNKNIRGNAGLLDQRLALKWVSSNIAAFGGDPSKVTLFGESAGAASVGFHLLSPGSHGFFQRAVMQSGSPNAPWASVSQKVAWDRSMRLSEALGCTKSKRGPLETCLELIKAKVITEMQYNITKSPLLDFPFVPTVDGVFLTDEVEKLLNSNNLPKKDLMIGFNKDEGTCFLVYGSPGFSITGQSLISRKDFLAGVDLTVANAHSIIKEAVISEYTDWTDWESRMKNRDSLGELFGDHTIVCPLVDFANKYSLKGGKTFFYFFDHRSSLMSWPEWMGVAHGYEIEFVFGMPLNTSLGYTKNEVNMTKKFMKHWTNFARTGQPGIDGDTWPLFTSQQEYVTLNYNHREKKMMVKPRQCQLWNSILPKIQRIADELESCAGSGTILHCNLFLLLILVVRSIMC